MDHKSISRLLIIAGVVAAAAAAIILFWLIPAWTIFCTGRVLLGKILLFTLDGLTAASFYAALFFYTLISIEIGKDRSFCRANVTNMKRIFVCLAICGFCFLGMAPVSAWILSGAGALWFDALCAAFICWGLGVIAYALSRLLDHAVSLQEENDLTV